MLTLCRWRNEGRYRSAASLFSVGWLIFIKSTAHFHLSSLPPFVAFDLNKSYLFTFLQPLIPFHKSGAVVNHHIFAMIINKKTVTFFVIEPLTVPVD